MPIIIDGYNLMYAAGILGHGVGPGSLARSRLAVLNFVCESIEPAEIHVTTVVFDARDAPPGLPRQALHHGITVRFSAGYESADELIEELIRAHSAPKKLLVVSSDHRLHRAASRRKAQAVDSEVWYGQVIASREARIKKSKHRTAKPPVPLAPSEVEFWLKQFVEPAERTAPTSGASTAGEAPPPAAEQPPKVEEDEIFPRDYLDSIERELND